MFRPSLPVRLILALVLVTAPLAAEAQYKAGKVWRIGILNSGFPPSPKPPEPPFPRRLRDLGWTEGQNIKFEWMYSEDRAERLPALAADLVRSNVDVIVAVGTTPAVAAKLATTTTPIVMLVVSDPVRSGLIPNLGRPGGNITGMSLLAPDATQKQVEILKEFAPTISRLASIKDPTNPGHLTFEAEVRAAASVLGLRLQQLSAGTLRELDDAMAAVLRERAEAVIVHPLPVPLSGIHRFADFAIKNRLPTLSTFPFYLPSGLLVSFGPSLSEQIARTAYFVDKILRGAKPADLPVEQPTKFELVINMKTAKTLGLTIPQSLLLRADQIIE